MNIRLAKKEDIDNINNLMQETILETIQNSFFCGENREFISQHIEHKGFTLIAEENNQFAGFFIVRMPNYEQDNLGYDLGFQHEELCLVAHMESVCVHKNFRGRGLQKQFIEIAEQMLTKNYDVHILLATVHPDNISSLKSCQSNGYKVSMTKEKYGGMLRHILRKDI